MGPIDPDAICMINTIISGGQGLWLQLGPKEALEYLFGIKTGAKATVAVQKNVLQSLGEMAGDAMVSMFIMPFLMLFSNADFHTAYIACNLVMAYKNLGYCLKTRTKGFGVQGFSTYSSRAGPLSSFLIRLICVIITMQDYDITDGVIKASIFYWGAVGIAIAIAPERAGRVFGLSTNMNYASRYLAKATGFLLLGASIFQGTVAFWDVPVTEALGYAVLANASWYAQGLMNGMLKKNGLPEKRMLLKMLLHIDTFATAVL